MADEIDITHKIERLELFEERLDIRLECLSAYCTTYDPPDEVYVEVHGELHPVDGAQLKSDTKLVIVAYDSDGRVVQVQEDWFSKENLYGFEAFSIYLTLPSVEVSKVRILPKRMNT